MCELLVRIKDKTNSDPVLDAGCTKRGDVIAVCPDGWTWGKKERTNREWRVVKLPETPVEDMEFLLEPERPPDLLKQYLMLRKRAVKLDLDSLNIARNPDAVPLTDRVTIRGEQIDAIRSVEAVKASIVAAASVKERLPEPNVIGPQDESVIGPK